MLTVTRKTTAATILTALLAVLSSAAMAESRKTVHGVVQSVDHATNQVTVVTKDTGETITFAFANGPKVNVGGARSSELAALSPGQTVKVKVAQAAPVAEVAKVAEKTASGYIKGEVLEVNLEQGTALIKPASGGAPQLVKLPDNLVIAGLQGETAAAGLKKGHLVTVKYAAQ